MEVVFFKFLSCFALFFHPPLSRYITYMFRVNQRSICPDSCQSWLRLRLRIGRSLDKSQCSARGVVVSTHNPEDTSRGFEAVAASSHHSAGQQRECTSRSRRPKVDCSESMRVACPTFFRLSLQFSGPVFLFGKR